MKKRSPVFILIVLFFVSCSNSNTSNDSKQADTKNKTEIVIPSGTKLLLDHLVETGDYINSREFPSLIKASVVFEELNNKNLILDIRNAENYKQGHIKGSINVNFIDIPEYFQSKIRPFEYEKIIIVCSTGQYASYTSSLLRLMGYGNVYAMRWGMSAWDKGIAKENWLKGTGSAYEGSLETKEVEKPEAGSFPEINSSSTGELVFEERIKQVFESGLDNTTISADSVFKDPSKYFIINLERKDKYDGGHIPGAVRYKPNGTLGIVEEMASLPAGKKIVIYCGTGHNSAFATAYLNLFGYQAHTLNYGNSSFMYNKMVKEKESLSWVLFGETDIHNYPLVK